MMSLLVTPHIRVGEPQTRPGGLLSTNTEVGITAGLAPRGVEGWKLVRPVLAKGESSVHLTL